MARQKAKRLIKEYCEICGLKNPTALQLHHIIERTEINTNNHPYNLAIICANCHMLVHNKEVRIIGVYPSTALPNGRTLVFERNGIKNVDLDVPYVEFNNKCVKLY